MATNIIGLKELRANAGRYIAEVGRGKSFTVVRRSKPVFTIVPVEETEKGWDSIFDAERDNKGRGVPVAKLLRILKKLERENKKK